MKPSSLARRRHQHICVFGDPKSGKSQMVSQLIKAGYRLTWVSMDNGHEVIFKLLSQGITPDVLDARLNIIVIPDTKESPIAVKTCAAIASGRPANICDAHGVVNCSACRTKGGTFTVVDTSTFTQQDILVFDHLGQLANSTMNLIMIKSKDEDKPEWEDYRVQGTLMDKFLTNVQQASYNIICISHPAEIKMEDGSKKLVPVIGSDNFSRNGGKYFDHLVYVEVSNGKHRFGSATTYKASVLTGSRSDVVIDSDGSLVPFFDGTILPPSEVAGNKSAQEVLQGVGHAVVAKVSAPTEQAASAIVETNKEEKVSEQGITGIGADRSTSTDTGTIQSTPELPGSSNKSSESGEQAAGSGSNLQQSQPAKPSGSTSTLALLARLKAGGAGK